MNQHSAYDTAKKYLGVLGLNGALAVLSQHLDADVGESHVMFLSKLLEEELEGRLVRRRETLRRFAGFPGEYRLSDYNFDYQPSLDRGIITELASLAFLSDARNAIFLGPPGVGKTMLAVALGYEAIEAGYKTVYTSAIDLVTRFHKAALGGRYDQVMRPFEMVRGSQESNPPEM